MKGGIKHVKEFEIKFLKGGNVLIDKIVQLEKLPEKYLQLTEEFINSELTIKRLK